jgi:integrase
MARRKVEYTLEAVAARLKVDKVGIAIRQRGKRLALRGTLPPKPGSEKPKACDQVIALHIYANEAGFEQAEALARKLGAEIASNRFAWDTWGEYTQPRVLTVLDKRPVSEWVELFKADKLSRKTIQESTWHTNYREVFRRLPQDLPLSAQMLLDELLTQPPDTRGRKRHFEALRALARFAGLEVNFEGLRGSYSARTVEPRDLPDDQTILDFLKTVPNPGWRTALARVIVFGLRPHEAWYLARESEDGRVRYRVSEGKTGSRLVFPLLPQWAEELGALDPVMPPMQRDHHTLGERFGEYFRGTHPAPFAPYDLRHCYAQRGFKRGVEPHLMARYMGHSLQMHLQIYSAWFSQKTYDDVFDSLTDRLKE